MNIINTIIPIFVLIMLGWLAGKRGFLPTSFLGPANRLVFYLAIPAMIFRALSKTDFHAEFDPQVVAGTLSAVIMVFAVAWGTGAMLHLKRGQRGSFIHTTFHGNLGYVGFAVVYYFLGAQGLARASIIASFVILVQNFLAVLVLQVYSTDVRSHFSNLRTITLTIIANPVIISAVAGMLFSIFAIPVPLVIGRSLDILSHLALPLALLIIGGSISFSFMRSKMAFILVACVLKLIALPTIGLIIFELMDLAAGDYLPGIILLAAPTATVTYVMANEMKGDPDFANAAISLSTIFSAGTFIFWLAVVP
jgi:malate permease and related proteins